MFWLTSWNYGPTMLETLVVHANHSAQYSPATQCCTALMSSQYECSSCQTWCLSALVPGAGETTARLFAAISKPMQPAALTS
jgi:hypothetical protein